MEEWQNSLWLAWFEQLKRRINNLEEEAAALKQENEALKAKLADVDRRVRILESL